MEDRELGPKDFMGRKPKQLLEILLLQEGRPVPKDQLAEKLWGESLPVNFSASLEHYVSLLRKRLDPGGRLDRSMVRTVHGGYRFEAGELQVDTLTFDRIYDRHVQGEATRADLETAVALVQGDLLEDEPYADWAAGPRAVYAQRHVELLVAGAQAALAAGDAVRGAELATAAVHRDAYAEPAHRLLMLAHYVQGRQSAALNAFERCRDKLTGELGVDPMPETTRLHGAILQQAPAARMLADFVGAPLERDLPAAPVRVAVPAPRRSVENEPGLPFVGRVLELAELLEAVHLDAGATSAPIVVLEGAPGSGKTRTLAELAANLGDRTVVRLTATGAERSLAGAMIGHLLGALCPGDPRLGDVLAAIPSAWDGGPVQRASIAGQVLAMVNDRSPFAVLIDDAENVDELSAQMLACLAIRLPSSSGAFVFGCRSGYVVGGHALASAMNVSRVHLHPLPAEALESFGIDGLAERTGGLPMFVAREVAQHLARQNGSAAPDVSPEQELDRFRRFGEQMFHLCVVAAIMREPIRPEPLGRLTGRDEVAVVEDLEKLCALHVLQVAGEGFAFRNKASKELLAATASPARRQLLQRRTRSTDPVDRRRASRLMPAAQNRRAGDLDRRARRATDTDYAELQTASAS